MKPTGMKILKVSLLFLESFGIWRGLLLGIKFSLGMVGKIKLPKIRHSFALRKGTSDIPVFSQVFLENNYQISFPISPKLIIDGGANIGLFAIKMKNTFPGANIICIEPEFENFQLLHKNLSLYEGMFFENCGLWNKDAKLKIHNKFNVGNWGLVVEEDEKEGTVCALSMNSLLRKYSIDFIDILKLDIETSEKQLFLDNYENWLPKVRILIIELHDWLEDGCSKPFFEAVNKTFSKYKYFIQGDNTIIINQDLL